MDDDEYNSESDSDYVVCILAFFKRDSGCLYTNFRLCNSRNTHILQSPTQICRPLMRMKRTGRKTHRLQRRMGNSTNQSRRKKKKASRQKKWFRTHLPFLFTSNLLQPVLCVFSCECLRNVCVHGGTYFT